MTQEPLRLNANYLYCWKMLTPSDLTKSAIEDQAIVYAISGYCKEYH